MTRFTSLLVVLMTAILVLPLWAGVPEMMNYQGRLTDNLGALLDTTVSMTFSIYDDSTGGNLIWIETHPTITVTQGGFSVLLGSISALSDTTIAGNNPVWMSFYIGGDPEIEPRTRLVSTPYAFHAATVDGFNPGPNNVDSGQYTFVAGDYNTVLTDYGSIAGGFGNVVQGHFSSVGGGELNIAGSEYPPEDTCFSDGLGGSYGMSISRQNTGAFVGGGTGNVAKGQHSTICAGFYNKTGCESGNKSYGHYAFVGGGAVNRAWGYGSSIVGGHNNQAGLCPD